MTSRLIWKVAKWLQRCAGIILHSGDDFVSTWPLVLRKLKRRGFRPRTVFDVGVARGTPDLYAAFPDAHYYLIDPTRESLPHMQQIARQLDAEVLNVALGDRDAEMMIDARPDDINGASFYKEVGELNGVEQYPVAVKRFDRLMNSFERPALCKIDVQGAELHVLQGMGRKLQDIDAVIVECSVLATLMDGPEISEVIAYMTQEGFALYDILDTTRRPLDAALAQVDLLFVPRNSALRADRRWAA